MEDTLQRVFSVLISILILFVLPLYITFEKMDDISYSLALKITSNFVDSVTAKGYITESMYNDFLRELSVTNNVYDIKMEHVSKKYVPTYYIYDDAGNLLEKADYAIYCKDVNDSSVASISVNGVDYNKYHTGEDGKQVSNIKLSYSTSEVKYSENQILARFENDNPELPSGVTYSKLNLTEYTAIDKNDIPVIPYMYGNYTFENAADGSVNTVLDNENKIYTMNKGDEFSIRIKNENTTIATVLFNAITMGIGGQENNTRVYINYGGTIEEEEYRNLDKVTE